MKTSPAQSKFLKGRRGFSRRSGVLFFLAAILWTGGCGARKRPSIPWATAVQVRPVVQAPTVGKGQTTEEAAPELRPAVPPYAAVLLPARSGPVRPHVATPPSSTSDPEKVASPVIAPQLSAKESVLARQETKQSLAAAEKNLAGAQGKSLNSMQADLVSKINGFLKDAREAAQSGDWSSARSLAKKAEVLSEELARSL